MPKEIVVGLVKATAFEGAYNENPYNFQTFNLKFCSLLVDSKNGSPKTSKTVISSMVQLSEIITPYLRLQVCCLIRAVLVLIDQNMNKVIHYSSIQFNT